MADDGPFIRAGEPGTGVRGSTLGLWKAEDAAAVGGVAFGTDGEVPVAPVMFGMNV